jgi:hypothetical protein
VNRGLNCCSGREGTVWLCDSWGVKTGCGLWGYHELITAASVKCTYKVQRENKNTNERMV